MFFGGVGGHSVGRGHSRGSGCLVLCPEGAEAKFGEEFGVFGAVPCESPSALGGCSEGQGFEGIWGVWGYVLNEQGQSFGVFYLRRFGVFGAAAPVTDTEVWGHSPGHTHRGLGCLRGIWAVCGHSPGGEGAEFWGVYLRGIRGVYLRGIRGAALCTHMEAWGVYPGRMREHSPGDKY